jgi:hypothetical protein
VKVVAMDLELYNAITARNLPRVKLLANGGTSTAARGDHPNNALITAALCGKISIVEWLLTVGDANISEASIHGYTAWHVLLCPATWTVRMRTVQWLLEIEHTNFDGETARDILQKELTDSDHKLRCYDSATKTALLRVVLLPEVPPPELVVRMLDKGIRIAREGSRLRAVLPTYLAHRRALLDAHCPLIAPLRDLVHGYEDPTTTTKLWATAWSWRRGHLMSARISRQILTHAY